MVALRLVHGMLVRDVPPLPPGTRAVAMIIAPRDSMRMEVFRYAIGAVLSKPELESMLVGKPRVDSFELRRPDGQTVYFETGVATAGGTAARGRWFVDFALDECAFFRDASYKVNDEELYNAGSATLLPGGQVLVTSTPWAEAGLLYRLWKDRPDNAAVAHAPTLLMNDNPVTRQIVAEAEASDPDNAAREFGAKFMVGGTTVFFEAATIDAAMTDEPFQVRPGDGLAAGADFGFRADSSALVKVALRGSMLHVYGGVECRPEDGVPLRPSVTVAEFARCIGGECGYVMADQHYREAIAEHLDVHGLAYAPAPTQPADTYVRARMLMREGRVRIHRSGLPEGMAERLEQQLREVQGKPTSGGGMSIIHPRWSKGGHGDIAAALVLALWQLAGDEVPEPAPEPGTREWEESQQEARRQSALAAQQRDWWQRPGGVDAWGRR